MTKRRRATDSIEAAHRKLDAQFIADYLQPDTQGSPWVTAWSHPSTGAKYGISMTEAGALVPDDLRACMALVEETSLPDYEKSQDGWHPRKKLKEMQTPGLRYVTVRNEDGALCGFTSLLPTYEEGEPVVYCYEVHLKPDLQGTGLGRLLMSFHSAVAANLPPIQKVMLTCFLSNARGLAFYRKLGFETDPISPQPRALRFGKTFAPDYVILSKSVPPAGKTAVRPLEQAI